MRPSGSKISYFNKRRDGWAPARWKGVVRFRIGVYLSQRLRRLLGGSSPITIILLVQCTWSRWGWAGFFVLPSCTRMHSVGAGNKMVYRCMGF